MERRQAHEEKHLLEQQFQQTQKLESLGVLAGGIAHDFNNILAIIMGYCSLTKMDYQDAEKHIPEIEKAAERAAALCLQMLAYAGKASLTQSQINTWMLVDEMVSMLKTTIPKDAANGKEALELYQQNAADITLVVTDMGMPVMNGYELFYRLKQLDQKLPIIISSGFGEGDIASKIPREAMAGMINKPYRFDQLRDVIRGVVESPV